MSQRHIIQSDRTMLITTNTFKREPIFKNPSFAREAIECLYRVQELYPFILYAFIIVPDHCHFLLRVPSPNTIAKVMNSYKSGLTFDLGIKKLWQRRFHIRYVDDIYEVKCYVHQNPVRKGLSESNHDYPWSSASGDWEVSSIPSD